MRERFGVALAVLVVATPGRLDAQAPPAPWAESQVRTIDSEILGETRELWVQTPQGYGEGTERYPLLLVLDAEQHFGYVAGMAALLGRYFEMPRVLVVGVPNTERGRDFFTRSVAPPDRQGDGASRFRAFVASELLPFVDDEYRTLGLRVMVGHSLTGLFAVATMITLPELVDATIAVSPSLQYPGPALAEAWAARPLRQRPESLFLATASPRDRGDIVAATDAFASLVGGSATLRSTRAVVEGENHLTVPIPAIHQGLRWLFEGWSPPLSVAGGGPEALLAHYRALSERFGVELRPSVEQLTFFARRLGGRGAVEAGLAFADEAARSDPASASASATRAEMLREAGDLERAREAFEEAGRRAEALGHAEHAAGHRDSARRLADRVARRASNAEARRYFPGVVETLGDEYGLVFAPDGERVYWVRRADRSGDETIVFADRQGDSWGGWRPVFGTGHYDKEPAIAPDGSALYFASTREGRGEGDEAFDLWVAEREGTGWREPRRLPRSVNSDGYDNYPSVAANGNLYFGSRRPGSRGIDLYVARREDGAYLGAENLGPAVNSDATDADPWIAPDESILLFSSTRPGGHGSGDLYVSRREEGSWTAPVNLGPAVNGDDFDYAPALSPDGSRLVFSRGWGQILTIEWPDCCTALR